jgi:hypothetical protein
MALLFRIPSQRPVHCVLLLSFLLAAAVSVAADDSLTKMQAQYAAETNTVDKAKILAKLGPRELSVARDWIKAGDSDKALSELRQYSDSVRQTTDALVASGIDASRHAAGFKELQISLRDSLRRLNDLILSSHQDLRPDFRSVRTDLEAAQNALIDALFPAPPPKPSGATNFVK